LYVTYVELQLPDITIPQLRCIYG